MLNAVGDEVRDRLDNAMFVHTRALSTSHSSMICSIGRRPFGADLPSTVPPEYAGSMQTFRAARPSVPLGLRGESAAVGDHLALFYDTDEEFAHALGFIETGLRTTDHGIVFGIPSDTEHMLRVLGERGWDVGRLMREGRLSVLRPEDTADATVAAVSRHFDEVLGRGETFIRFLGNAAVGRPGWPAADEFYKLEAAVSAASLELPCVAICMFDLRTQSAQTIVKAAFEGHPMTIHRNCIRENPLYVPRSARL
jgi:hypothetical protein